MATDEALEGEIVDDSMELTGSTALMAITKSEIDTQIATAKRYPRSITNFRRKTHELACLDEETAASMFYSLPRGGKQLEGPSVRMAEVCASAYQNLRFGARVIEITDTVVVAQGFCMDLETNNATTIEVRRRITNKSGQRFNEDMIVVTGNAACAIALRNAIFKVIPFALIKPIYEQAKLASIGKAVSMATKRQQLLDNYAKAGVSAEKVIAFLGHKGIDDITVEDLITMRGVWTAIKDGDTTIDEAFGSIAVAGDRATKSKANAALQSQPKSAAADNRPETLQPSADDNAPSPSLDATREALIDLDNCETLADIDIWLDTLPNFLAPDDRAECQRAAESKKATLKPKGRRGKPQQDEMFDNGPDGPNHP